MKNAAYSTFMLYTSICLIDVIVRMVLDVSIWVHADDFG